MNSRPPPSDPSQDAAAANGSLAGGAPISRLAAPVRLGLSHIAEQPAFRRPKPPEPLEIHEIVHPALPPELDGIAILHLTDVHTTRGRPTTAGHRALLRALQSVEVDVICLTGDYMTNRGDESSAVAALAQLAGAWRTRAGAFGIFGNHDSSALEARCRQEPKLASVRWLRNEIAPVRPAPGGPTLQIVGCSYPEDVFGTMLGMPVITPDLFTLALVHYPTEIWPAAEAGVPLVLSGHTHGGQIRMSRHHAPHTSSDLPGGVASGLMRLRNTLLACSRGVGSTVVDLRVNCPPQAPIYVLRRGELPELRGEEFLRLRVVDAW